MNEAFGQPNISSLTISHMSTRAAKSSGKCSIFHFCNYCLGRHLEKVFEQMLGKPNCSIDAGARFIHSSFDTNKREMDFIPLLSLFSISMKAIKLLINSQIYKMLLWLSRKRQAGEGRSRSLGLADANYYIQDG